MKKIKDGMYSPKKKNIDKLVQYLKENTLFNIEESIKKGKEFKNK